jgi:hypothetical protein
MQGGLLEQIAHDGDIAKHANMGEYTPVATLPSMRSPDAQRRRLPPHHSTYLNQLVRQGRQVAGVAEAGAPGAAVDGCEGIDAYVHPAELPHRRRVTGSLTLLSARAAGWGR